MAKTIVATSIGELRRSADTRPSGTPTAIAKIIAQRVSSTVVGRRSMSSCVTGRRMLDRFPEVALGDLAEVDPELDEDRLVEAVAMDEVVAHGVGGALPEHRPARVAGDQAGEREHDEDDPEQDHGDRHEEPPEKEARHGRSSAGE